MKIYPIFFKNSLTRDTQLRDKLSRILGHQMDGKAAVLVDIGIWKDRLSSWDFRTSAPAAFTSPCQGSYDIPVYRGSSRVLELGCSDGRWCFHFKNRQPGWIVEGVDDTDHWSCINRDVIIWSVVFHKRTYRHDFWTSKSPSHVY
jgi:hypothetical protein